ncbi:MULTISPECIES: protein translocase subunit SecD [unclassified Massilia]|uniref:protein translocase subunit SecD n=1 Tax=unclassified Massilia TaxID=2609279 RepID=UPI00177B320B|nr:MULTISPECIES: protein translocase subunit SecD [unclassified Massilia]MBD8530921.1 protein translocase subunit SecD [Massilia sp. CFBP 13647]MBD8674666.1 protein translocase subunit SecD [Massilia sp. CFBP 13721]
MNRYPVWKYILIAVALLLGALYTAPNYFGESPALQVTTGKTTVKITSETTSRVADVLTREGVPANQVTLDGAGNSTAVRARFATTDAQFKAKLALERQLNRDPADPDYIVTVNLVKNTPAWMQTLNAKAMNLGLDLRGGVHFLLQVDSKAVLETKIKGTQASVRSILRDKNVRHAGIERVGNTVEVTFRDAATRAAARTALSSQVQDLAFADAADGTDLKLMVTLKPEALKRTVEEGVNQNITTLSKRINELGVTEPVIQRQGADRIVVQLPGVQDVARAKDIIGRTATLEMRMVDSTITPGTELSAAIPLNSELFTEGRGAPVVVSKDIILTGDYISSAVATFDQNQQPAVSLDLNGDGGRKIRLATRENIGKRMAILLKEKGKYTVPSAPTIQGELGSTFQITGIGSIEDANELALLLRSGALSAPMEFIEERVVGPQLGAENIDRGLHSTVWGFVAIAIFMIIYYHMFGVFSALALAANVMFLLALLSMLQATLTLPGIAAIALALGMAIDANVLINERIREELRAGATPQMAITNGFSHAWDTIFDSNVTTLIVGLALLIFGSGAVRGFAVVHTLGILTSMFSAVFVSRGIANFWYGRRGKKLTKLSVGTVWTPGLPAEKK